MSAREDSLREGIGLGGHDKFVVAKCEPVGAARKARGRAAIVGRGASKVL